MAATTLATDKLVTADWVQDHRTQFEADDPEYVLVEINSPGDPDEDFPSAYEDGHIPGAIGFTWDEDLTDQVRRDVLSKDAFETTIGDAGITEDSTVVLYGDGHIPNWFALFAYWEFKYFGHRDVRVLDGGKQYWVENDYELTQDVPSFTARTYRARGPFEGIRAYREDVEHAIESGNPLVDVRSPEEFSGELIAPPDLDETAQRGGHIPTATNVPIATVLKDDGTFKDEDELRDLYAEKGVTADESVITYCRVGERSAIEWFALHELLDFEDVRNYDGSWTEWGNIIRAPIEIGSE